MSTRNKKYAIGVMSGTSADGLDAALISYQPGLKDIKLEEFSSKSFSPLLQKQILKNMVPEKSSVAEISDLNAYLSYETALLIQKLLKKKRVPRSKVTVVGSHGQTLYYFSQKRKKWGHHFQSTLQIGDGPTLAALSGIPVVNNFRTKDLARGGLGAPLVPFAHKQLFYRQTKKISVHNLGGISNLTYLSAKKTLAFDTGPANSLIDQCAQHFFKKKYDRNGSLARKGEANDFIVRSFLKHSYFRKKPPKTTGREDFGEDYFKKLLIKFKQNKISSYNALATVTEMTARAIVKSYDDFIIPNGLDEVYFCGGGAKNGFLIKRLQNLLSVPAKTTAETGFDPQAIEAISFAILAVLALQRKPNLLPAVAGSKRVSSLGQISFPE